MASLGNGYVVGVSPQLPQVTGGIFKFNTIVTSMGFGVLITVPSAAPIPRFSWGL